MSKLPVIERPSGKTYRPRKLSAETLGNEDEITSIVIFGTHDVVFARLHAESEAQRLTNEFYGDGIRLEVASPGRHVWWRRNLAAWDEDAPVYQFTDDPNHGRAGVCFHVDEVEEP